MLTGISKAGNSSSAPLRHCARCLRIARARTPKPAYLERTFSTATSTATESTISIDDPPTAYSASIEAGPSRDRMRNVWSASSPLMLWGAADEQLECKIRQKDNVS
jgi:hypothetical protein